MSCLKHSEKIEAFCQSCAVFLCSKCPTHHHHIQISYDLYLGELKSELESHLKHFESQQKQLEMLELKIQGLFSAVQLNHLTATDSLNSAILAAHELLEKLKDELFEKIKSVVDEFTKPLISYTDRIQGYLLEINRKITESETLLLKVSGLGPQDPILTMNEKEKLNASEVHYIDTFINNCKKGLIRNFPVVPVVEHDFSQIKNLIFLDFHSKHFEVTPLFPYWSIDKLLPDLKLKDHGSIISSKSDHWAAALFQNSFSSGKGSIEFLITKDASASKLYLGIIASNAFGLNLHKPFSSSSGYPLWAYRICGEMHSKGFIYNKLKEKRRYRRGDKIKILMDMERMLVTFYKNSEEMYTFVNIAENVIPFVCFGEACQSVKVLSVDYDIPQVIFH